MTHQQTEELVAAYALDSVEDRRAADEQLLDHVAGCESCRALFLDLREVAGDLALAATPVPVSADLEARVLAAARGESQDHAPAVRRPSWFARRSLVAASVVGLLALGALGGAALRSPNDSFGRQVASILADPKAERAPICARGCTVAVTARGDGVLLAPHLKTPPAGKVYELWLIKDGTPLAVRVFTPGRDGTQFLFHVTRADYDAAAVTVERRLEQRPTGAMVYSAALKA